MSYRLLCIGVTRAPEANDALDMLMKDSNKYPGIRSFSFLCRTLRIVGQKESTKSLIAGLSDCFPSSSCILLREYWNLVPNDYNIHVKKDKDMAATQDLVLTFCLKIRCVPRRKLKLLMPVLFPSSNACLYISSLLGKLCPVQPNNTATGPWPRLWQIRR